MNPVSTNTLRTNDRVQIGKKKEEFILDLLNSHVQVLPNGKPALTWYPSRTKQDMHQKIDAFVCSEQGGEDESVQIKHRETGTDLGLSLIRPWISLRYFKDLDEDFDDWDRDYPEKYGVDWYILSLEEHRMLLVVGKDTVKKVINKMLSELKLEDEFEGTFKKENLYGAELKLVTDKGDGGTGGQKKLICYIKPVLLQKLGNCKIITY